MRKRYQLFMLEYPRYERRELPSVFVTQPPCFDKDAFFDAVMSPKTDPDPVVLVAQDEYEEPIDSLAGTLAKAECVCVSVDAGPTYIRVFTVLLEVFESPEKRRARLKSMLGDGPAKEKKENFLQKKYRVRKQRKAEAGEDAVDPLERLLDLLRENRRAQIAAAALLLFLVVGLVLWGVSSSSPYEEVPAPPAEREVAIAPSEGDAERDAQALREAAAAAEAAEAAALAAEADAADAASAMPAWEAEQFEALHAALGDDADVAGASRDEIDDVFGVLLREEDALQPASGPLGDLSAELGEALGGPQAPAVLAMAFGFFEVFAEAARQSDAILEAHRQHTLLPPVEWAPRVRERDSEDVDYVEDLRERREIEAALPGTGPVARLVVVARDRLESDEEAGPVERSARFAGVPDLPVPETLAARAAQLRGVLEGCTEGESEQATMLRHLAQGSDFLLAGVVAGTEACGRALGAEACGEALGELGCEGLHATASAAEAALQATQESTLEKLLVCLDEEGVGHLVSDENLRALRLELERVTAFLPVTWLERARFAELDAERVSAFPCALLPAAMAEERPALLRHLHP